MFFDCGFTVRDSGQRLLQVVASPGNAPGLQGYEPQVETSRLAIVVDLNGRDGRTRTCFPVLPRHVVRLLHPHRGLFAKEIQRT